MKIKTKKQDQEAELESTTRSRMKKRRKQTNIPAGCSSGAVNVWVGVLEDGAVRAVRAVRACDHTLWVVLAIGENDRQASNTLTDLWDALPTPTRKMKKKKNDEC